MSHQRSLASTSASSIRRSQQKIIEKVLDLNQQYEDLLRAIVQAKVKYDRVCSEYWEKRELLETLIQRCHGNQTSSEQVGELRKALEKELDHLEVMREYFMSIQDHAQLALEGVEAELRMLIAKF